MSMTFWDTVRGHHLADTLIRCLPKIAKEEKENQKCFVVERKELYEKVESLISEGLTFYQIVDDGSDKVMIIMIQAE